MNDSRDWRDGLLKLLGEQALGLIRAGETFEALGSELLALREQVAGNGPDMSVTNTTPASPEVDNPEPAVPS